jgi:TPR repeat protein
MEWQHYSHIDPLPPEQIARQKIWAESGNADAQYFMGLASQDKDERLVWLKKAIANGSKGAAAYYSRELDERWVTPLADPAVPHGPRKPVALEVLKDLLKPVIEAAEAGDPQSASWLMERGQEAVKSRTRLAHPIVKLTDVPKWAAIAARGGNPAAAEWLCAAHYRGYRDHPGVEKDDAQAFYWCSMVAPRFCAGSARVVLSELYREGSGAPVSKTLANYWSQRYDIASKNIQIERQPPFRQLPR